MEKGEFFARATTAHGTFEIIATKTGLRDSSMLPDGSWVELTTPERDENGCHRIIRIRQEDIQVIEYFDSEIINLSPASP